MSERMRRQRARKPAPTPRLEANDNFRRFVEAQGWTSHDEAAEGLGISRATVSRALRPYQRWAPDNHSLAAVISTIRRREGTTVAEVIAEFFTLVEDEEERAQAA